MIAWLFSSQLVNRLVHQLLALTLPQSSLYIYRVTPYIRHSYIYRGIRMYGGTPTYRGNSMNRVALCIGALLYGGDCCIYVCKNMTLYIHMSIYL